MLPKTIGRKGWEKPSREKPFFLMNPIEIEADYIKMNPEFHEESGKNR